MTLLAQRNGTAPPQPRRLGSIPYTPNSGGLYQLEQWQLPGVGLVWYAARGGVFASSRGFDSVTLDGAQETPTPEAAKALIHSIERPAAAAPPMVLLYRVGGERFYLEEQADRPGRPWRVRIGDTPLPLPAVYITSPTGETAEYPNAAAAQLAVEEKEERRRRPLRIARLRIAVDLVARGELDVTVGPVDPDDGSWTVSFKPRGAAS